MIAPHKEPVFVRQRSNTILTANMPETQMSAGRGKKFHFPLIKISPKWERWVKAKAELSIREAVKFPTDFAKLEWTIPLKNNSSPTGLNTMPVTGHNHKHDQLVISRDSIRILYDFPM